MNRPNIILILTDHLRPDVLTGPNRRRTMPAVTALADRGTLFTNCYSASPLCQPARASIITGLYPSQHGICGNQALPIAPWFREGTFMQDLKQAGYFTAMIGKHHYLDRAGMDMDVREDYPVVKEYGFDHVFTVDDDHINLYNNDEYTQYLKDTGRFEEFKRVFEERAWECGTNPFPEDDTPDGFIGVHGEQFIRKYDREYSRERPFYLNLSFIGPHPPYWHPGELRHDPETMAEPLGADGPTPSGAKCSGSVYKGDVLYEAKRLTAKENRAHYMDKCSLIDRQIGRLVKVLEERGLIDNTVIILTSDHGDNLGDYGIWDKRFFYEQSIGVPLVMAGPGIPRQERLNGVHLSKALVTHLDLFPTILELAGVSGSKDLVGTSAGADASVVSAKSDLAGTFESRELAIASADGDSVRLSAVGTSVGASAGRGTSRTTEFAVNVESSDRVQTVADKALVGHNLRRPGKSLLSMLRDGFTGGPSGFHDAVYAELATSVMIRTAGWKLVFDPEQGGVTHLYNLTVDYKERENLAGRAGYETITARLIERLLAHRILSTQYTHQKEEKRLQRVRAGL